MPNHVAEILNRTSEGRTLSNMSGSCLAVFCCQNVDVHVVATALLHEGSDRIWTFRAPVVAARFGLQLSEPSGLWLRGLGFRVLGLRGLGFRV